MPRLRNNDATIFTEDRLILCEGPTDRATLRALVDHYQLPSCLVKNAQDLCGVKGRAGFSASLEAIRGWTNFDQLRDIIIVTDSDSDPPASFREVANAVQQVPPPTPPDAPHTYPVPTAAHVKANGAPNITVIMVPWYDEPGAIETICYEAATRNARPIVQCIDQFAQCTGADQWSAQKLAKMKMRSFFSSTVRDNPDLSLTFNWTRPNPVISIADPAFDRLRAELARI